MTDPHLRHGGEAWMALSIQGFEGGRARFFLYNKRNLAQGQQVDWSIVGRCYAGSKVTTNAIDLLRNTSRYVGFLKWCPGLSLSVLCIAVHE